MNLQLFNQEKTEAATPRRREEARKQGQVFKSMEVVGSITLLATYFTLQFVGPMIAEHVLAFSRTLWAQGAVQDWSQAGVRLLMVRVIALIAVTSAPLLLVAAAAGVAGNVLQVGFLFTLQPLVPNFRRINPVSGLQRLFSRRALVDVTKALVKLGLVGYVVYATIAGRIDSFPQLLGLEMNQVATFLMDLVSSLLLWVGVSSLALALGDYLYQRWEHEDSLKMTKQETKEEFKQTEGNPQIRNKIRQKQREMARKRMMQDVPKADVVVTNPTHYAVALEYKAGMTAPKVLAKGQGLVALRIRSLASDHAVPVVENPPLARLLHRSVEVGDQIPADQFQAVAEVLAYVYQLRQKGY